MAGDTLEGESRSFGSLDELDTLWRAQGFEDVEAGFLEVSSDYADFDELWGTFQHGVGPAGQYVASLDPDARAALRDEYRRRLGDPTGPLALRARSTAVRGTVPA